MRKYLSFVLTFFFLFNIAGFHLWFKLLQTIIHNETNQRISNGIDEKDLTLIVVKFNEKPDIKWVEPEKELQYKGEMYDVVKIKYQYQKKLYYCFKDICERQLIVNYLKTQRSTHEGKERLKRIFSMLYLPRQIQHTERISFTTFSFPALNDFMIIRFQEVPYPPPKPV
ncbi:MAG: hypothetical protein NTU44_02360 [Bacteroidetes bacterium]|nr:hypothetical protein [Bacteroidota bacterium]